jgi:hypothetical protein
MKIVRTKLGGKYEQNLIDVETAVIRLVAYGQCNANARSDRLAAEVHSMRNELRLHAETQKLKTNTASAAEDSFTQEAFHMRLGEIEKQNGLLMSNFDSLKDSIQSLNEKLNAKIGMLSMAPTHMSRGIQFGTHPNCFNGFSHMN